MNDERWMHVDHMREVGGVPHVLIHTRRGEGHLYAVPLAEAALLAKEIQDTIRDYVAHNLTGVVDLQTGHINVPMMTTDDPPLHDALARCGVVREPVPPATKRTVTTGRYWG